MSAPQDQWGFPRLKLVPESLLLVLSIHLSSSSWDRGVIGEEEKESHSSGWLLFGEGWQRQLCRSVLLAGGALYSEYQLLQ